MLGFWQSLPASGLERERAILAAVEAGRHDPLTWARVDLTLPGGPPASVEVASLPLSIEGIFVPTSAETSQRIADLLEVSMLTPRVSDLAWRQAKHRLRPLPQPAWVADGTMGRTDRFIEYSMLVADEIRRVAGAAWDPASGEMAADCGKDWVLSGRLFEKPGWAANYGWHKPDGSVWQPVGMAHDRHHSDYSQLWRGMRRLTIGGRQVPFAEALADGLHRRLLSSDAACPPRYPGVTETQRKAEPVQPDADPPSTDRVILKQGDVGERVKAWQRVVGVTPDARGTFGPKTAAATRLWKLERDRGEDGSVVTQGDFDAAAMERDARAAAERLEIEFLQARNYTKAGRKEVWWVVLHSAEAIEREDTAKRLAQWAAGPHAAQSSWHYAIDNRHVWQSVREEDVAWHAPGANRHGIGIEHAGYARQSAMDWDDAYSASMLEISARLLKGICQRWSIPIEFVDAEGLVAGKRGVTTHWEVTKASRLATQRGIKSSPLYGKHGSHGDPGSNFPLERYLQMAREAP